MRKAGDVLRDLLKERGWPTEDPYAPLFRGWEDIAGPELGPRSRVVEVEDGVVVIEVDHPGWLQMLQLRQAGILEVARRMAPQAEIEGIKARVGQGPAGPGTDH